jgi:hypothetical protein
VHEQQFIRGLFEVSTHCWHVPSLVIHGLQSAKGATKAGVTLLPRRC